MEIPRERYLMLGILFHLNHPAYLKKIKIKCVEDIFCAMEEAIEDKNTQLHEFERYYLLSKDENDNEIFLDKINNLKFDLLNMKNLFNFIKK